MLGYYLLKLNCVDPTKEEAAYLINWHNKLDIGNCDLQILKEQDASGKITESIVVSYKAIGINTYNVFVIDLDLNIIKYWHESY